MDLLNYSAVAHKALPSKPLNTVALHDADHESALRLVKTRLHDAGVDVQFSPSETEKIQYLGGRASDLASVCLYPAHVTFAVQHVTFTAHTQNACRAEAFGGS